MTFCSVAAEARPAAHPTAAGAVGACDTVRYQLAKSCVVSWSKTLVPSGEVQVFSGSGSVACWFAGLFRFSWVVTGRRSKARRTRQGATGDHTGKEYEDTRPVRRLNHTWYKDRWDAATSHSHREEWMTVGKIKVFVTKQVVNAIFVQHDVSSVIRLSSLQEAPLPQHLGERWMVGAYMPFWGDDFGNILPGKDEET